MNGKTADTERFKHNRDLLESQQREFTKGGVLLKNVFSISARHPVISIIFALSFGAVINGLYDLLSYPVVEDEVSLEGALLRAGLVALFAVACVFLVLRVRSLHKNMFVYEPLERKHVLLTLVSKGKHSFKDTPSYATYETLLYTESGHANVNNLQKVILVTTELADVNESANNFKDYIENGGRDAEVYSIAINNRSLLEIQSQFKLLLDKIENTYSANDIIADYTGGTKDMSIALFKESEKRLITPVYLQAATDGDYGKGRSKDE